MCLQTWQAATHNWIPQLRLEVLFCLFACLSARWQIEIWNEVWPWGNTKSYCRQYRESNCHLVDFHTLHDTYVVSYDKLIELEVLVDFGDSPDKQQVDKTIKELTSKEGVKELLRYPEDHQLISDHKYGFRQSRSAGDLLVFRSIKVAVDGACSDSKSVNAGIPQGCVLSPTLFLLHINDMLQIDGIHCYADDSTVETLLNRVTNWGRLNLVQFTPTKTQVCAFTAKKIPFVVSPLFENTPLTASATSIGILGVDISSDVQFRDHLEGKAKLASKKLGVLNRSRMYFTPAHRLQLYKAQVRPHMEYCSHLWAGAPQYQLLPLDRIQRRAARFVDDQDLSDQLDPLALRRDVASLCIFYLIYHGECSEELFGLIPAAAFCHRTSRQKFHPHHLDAWLFTTVRFCRNFLPRTTKLWHILCVSGPIRPKNLERAYFFLKGRHRICDTPCVASVHGRR
ncbi:hypothetical protein evm_014757, partial [Chilo suppressalis]